jgi:hypothetical protein
MMWIRNVHLLSHHWHQSFHTSHYNFNYNPKREKKNYIFCFASYKRIVVEGTPLLTQRGGIVKNIKLRSCFIGDYMQIFMQFFVTNHEQHETQSLKL